MIFANGLSAPQHSTYFVILLDGRDLDGTPGVAKREVRRSREMLKKDDERRMHKEITNMKRDQRRRKMFDYTKMYDKNDLGKTILSNYNMYFTIQIWSPAIDTYHY